MLLELTSSTDIEIKVFEFGTDNEITTGEIDLKMPVEIRIINSTGELLQYQVKTHDEAVNDALLQKFAPTDRITYVPRRTGNVKIEVGVKLAETAGTAEFYKTVDLLVK